MMKCQRSNAEKDKLKKVKKKKIRISKIIRQNNQNA